MQPHSLFVGLSVRAPWPNSYPKGRLLQEEDRHITLAYLGHPNLRDPSSLPRPSFTLGQTAISNKILFLPKRAPRTVAYDVEWVSGEEELAVYRKELSLWAKKQGVEPDPRPFHPHVTVARSPFIESEWETSFEPLPFMITAIHLYESAGNLSYPPVFSIPLMPCFTEISHTADLAFTVRGRTLEQLYANAALAISFEFPPFFTYRKKTSISSLNEVVKLLNQMISECDCDLGCPFKAVSYHGNLEKKEQWLSWEMIVDV